MESLDTMGHLTAAADRGRTVQSHYPNEAQPSYGIAKDYYQTFLMTNVEPQFITSGSTDPWTEFEDYLRENIVGTFNNNTNSFGGQGRELYIIAGRDGENGTINSPNGYQLSVPSHLWKVVLVMDRPGQNIADITQNTTAFALEVPNNSSISGRNWREYIVSINDLESVTGYDFLSNVPEEIQELIENNIIVS